MVFFSCLVLQSTRYQGLFLDAASLDGFCLCVGIYSGQSGTDALEEENTA